jgi:hypothetical protein
MTATYAKLESRLKSAANLRDLCDLMNTVGEAWDEMDPNTIATLPVYGGAAPRSTDGVWSWDATSLLVTNPNEGSGKPFTIKPRSDYEA